jgi:hypothetical protein
MMPRVGIAKYKNNKRDGFKVTPPYLYSLFLGDHTVSWAS